MNKLLETLGNVIANKHTSTAALVFFALGVAGILWPNQKDKLDEISKLAIMYGLLSAGDAGKGQQPVFPPTNKDEPTKG